MDLRGAEIRNIYKLCMMAGGDSEEPLKVNIPYYQRPYKWGKENIEKLLSDFKENKDGTESEEYFVGSVVTVIRDDESSDIIDGQQRLTTVFLVNFTKFLLLRAYIEQLIIQKKQSKINEQVVKLKECYVNLIGGEKNIDLNELEKNIKALLEEIDDSDNKEEVYERLERVYQKGIGLPETSFNNTNYDREYKKEMEAFLLDEKLALTYSRDSINEQLKKALSSVCIKLTDRDGPSIHMVNESLTKEDTIIKQYVDAMICIFNWYISRVDETNKNKSINIAKDMIDNIDILLKNIKFCVVITGNENDAYTMFEVLNDRALKVDDLDLIKNLFFRHYCIKSGDTFKIQDKRIDELDTIWCEKIFGKELSADGARKYVAYFATIYLTGATEEVLNKQEQYRNAIEKKYLNSIRKDTYTFDDIKNDFSIILGIKEIVTEWLKFSNQYTISIKLENENKYSITRRCLVLLHSLKQVGVMCALINVIIKSFIVKEKSIGIENFDIIKFKEFIKEISEDKNNQNQDLKHIHQFAYDLWRMALLSKNYDIPRKWAVEVVKQVNHNTEQLNKSDLDFKKIDFEEAKKQFKEWVHDWKYGMKSNDFKIKILFLALYKFKIANGKLSKCVGQHYLETSKIALDHLEANKIPDVNQEKYFTLEDEDERNRIVNKLGNFMILDQPENNEKSNKPLYYALKWYKNMAPNHWLVEEIIEMLENNNYSDEVQSGKDKVRVPNEKFFKDRGERIYNYFESMLEMSLDEVTTK